MDTYILISDASRRYGLSIDTFRRWARTGRVRCWRNFRGQRLFDVAELERLLKPRPEVVDGQREGGAEGRS